MPAAGLTLVVAGVAFGKTTALAQWAQRGACAWYACTEQDAVPSRLARGIVDALRLRVPGLPATLVPAAEGRAGPHGVPDNGLAAESYAAVLADALDAALPTDLTLVLDDVHLLGAKGPAVELLGALAHAAAQRLRLVLLSRLAVPFPVERLRAQGRLLELGAAELAFTADEIDALLADLLDEEPGGLAGVLHLASGGWPGVVRLAAEHLRRVPSAERTAALDGLLGSDGPLLEVIGTRLLDHEPAEVRAFLRRVAPLRSFTPGLCAAVGVPGPAEAVRDLARRGLFLVPAPGAAEEFRLAPLVRALVLERDSPSATEREAVLRAAAAWFVAAGRHAEAAECLLDLGDGPGIAALLREHGQALLAAGGARAVVAAARAVPAPLGGADLLLLRGQAHQLSGEWDRARALYSALDDGGPLPPALAWRLGSLTYMLGRLPEALAIYERGVLDGVDTADEALLLAWAATAWLRQGDAKACEEASSRAVTAATVAGDDAALAAAHTAAAMLAAFRGDHAANDHHYLSGLDAATRAGDVLQIVRIRTNRSSVFGDDGAYVEAVAEATLAIDLGEAGGVTPFRGTALINRGEAYLHLGRLEEAVADLEAARALYQRLGTQDVGYPVLRLADVWRERGQRARATASYREAIALAEAVGDRQGLVPALVGLAWTLCEEDPPAALAVAERAAATGPGTGRVAALVALAGAQLSNGAAAEAAATALLAVAEAGQRHDRPGLAHALELRAAASPQHAGATGWLEEAVALWDELGSPLGRARTQLRLARHRAGLERRILAEEAATALRALGARSHAVAAERLARGLDAPVAEVTVHALGAFRVLRRGEPVPLAAWQSRKARELLKLLIVRRGHPAPRDGLIAALWPDEDHQRLGNRLSVQLSILRGVLDPERAYPPSRYVLAEAGIVRLDLEHVTVDVEGFLATATAGLDRLAVDDTGAAMALLTRAEADYTGSFLEEDLYEAWAVPLREEVQATYIDVLRALARHRAVAGEPDGAARLYRRLLERDRYDEPAHLALVDLLTRAEHHGEARRCHAAYVRAMAELGVEPSPFPPPARHPQTT